MSNSERSARGFTLVELLTVIALITILVAMLMPALQRARELSNRARCQANQKVLVQAAVAYAEAWRCLAALGWGPNYDSDNHVYDVLYYWYEKPMVGQYFGEDVPRGATVDGWEPPRKSVLRCPTQAVWAGMDPRESWIAYNSQMAYDCQPLGTGHRCYWRGPKIEEVRTGAQRFVLFADGRGSGVYYIGNTAYCDGSYDMTNSPSTTDARHNGGVNFGFLDGHVSYFADPTIAHFERKVLLSAKSENK